MDEDDCSLLSVVMATYERPEDTVEAIESIRQSIRTYKSESAYDLDVEAIIVTKRDDKETLARLRELQWDALTVLATDRRHGAHNRDVGFRYAEGEYIVSVDSDCVVAEDWITTIVQSLYDHDFPGAIQGGNFLDYPPESNWITRLEAGLDHERFDNRVADSRNLVIRADVYRRMGGYDTSHLYAIMGEDNFITERVEGLDEEMAFDSRIQVAHKYPTSVAGNMMRHHYYGRGAIHVWRYNPSLYSEVSAPSVQWYYYLTGTAEAVHENPRELLSREPYYLLLRTIVYTVGVVYGLLFFLGEEAGLVDPTEA
jgi:GT2 family glycosyltransferase